MRTVSTVRWAGCTLALAISIVPASVVPASADRAPRSIAACASFDQVVVALQVQFGSGDHAIVDCLTDRLANVR